MDSRTRLLNTVNHIEPDRIPYDLAGSHVSGITLKAYNNLREYLGLQPDDSQMADMVQQVVVPGSDLLEKLNVDTRGLFPLCSHNIPLPMYSDKWHQYHEETDDGWRYPDEWGITQFFPKQNGLYYSIAEYPLDGFDVTVEQVDALALPDGGESWRFDGLAEKAEQFRKEGKAVIVKSICAGLFEMGQRIRGMENFLCDLMVNPEVAHRVMDRVLESKLRFWETAFRELGDRVDVVVESDDYGTQDSQLIPPDTFREMIKPKVAQLISHIRKLAPDVKFFFHSCGNVRSIIPDLIEIGVDILNPIHITAAGMEPMGLKKDFGKDICFWGGGVETQHVLPNGTPQQVRDDVRRNIDALAPGGGWVFNTVHNIQADCPPENIMAMWETLQEFGAS